MKASIKRKQEEEDKNDSQVLNLETHFSSVAISENYIATCDKDHTISIWNLETGKYVQTLRGHTSDVYEVVYLPIKKCFVSLSHDKIIRFWSIENEFKCILAFPQRCTQLLNVKFSPDDLSMATISWGVCKNTMERKATIHVWSYDPENRYSLMQIPSGLVEQMIFSPNGQNILTVCDNGLVYLWCIESEKCDYIWEDLSPICFAAFSPDGRFLAIVGPTQTTILCTKTKKCLQTLKQENIFVGKGICIFSKNSKYYIHTTEGNKICVWSTETWNCIRMMNGHTGPIHSMFIHPKDDQILITASEDKTFRFWNFTK